MKTPTNIQTTSIGTMVTITWDCEESPLGGFEIMNSLNSGGYTLFGTVEPHVRVFSKDTLIGINKFKLRAFNDKSEFLTSYYYTNYNIIPLYEPGGGSLHVEFQRGNIMFASKTGYLMWSVDSGNTFKYVAFEDSDIIVYSYIFSNGNVLFATLKNELWLGQNSLSTVTQKYLLNADNSPFVYHTPVDALYPGIYFKTLNTGEPTVQEGTEMLVAGTYSMYNMAQENGATPVIVWYSKDCGETTKVAYRFGPLWKKDDGTAIGGATGTVVGDESNAIVCPYHVHYVSFDPYTNEWFVSCGETGTMLKGTYNITTDVWSWTRILNAPNKMYKSCGMIATPTHYILISDEMNTADYKGIFKWLKSEFLDYTKAVRLYTDGEALAPSLIYGNTVIAPHWDQKTDVAVSLDRGETWNTYLNMPLIPPLATYKTLSILSYPNTKGEVLVTPYNWHTGTPYGKQSYLIKFK